MDIDELQRRIRRREEEMWSFTDGSEKHPAVRLERDCTKDKWPQPQAGRRLEDYKSEVNHVGRTEQNGWQFNMTSEARFD